MCVLLEEKHMLLSKLSVFFLVSVWAICGVASPLNDFINTPEASHEIENFVRVPETMNKVTLLHLGKNSLEMRKKLISESKRFVFIDVPFWAHDTEGTELLDQLFEKTKQYPEFQISVIQDWMSPLITKGGKQILSELRLRNLLWNSPAWQRRFSFALKRNHLHDKMFIVDGEKMIMGGMNMADEYLQGGTNEKGWHDTDILLEGPVVQQATGIFLKVWQLGTYLADKRDHFPPWEKQEINAMNSYFYDNVEDHDFKTMDTQTDAQVTMPVHIGIQSLLQNPFYFPQLPKVADPDLVSVRLIYDNPLLDRTPDGKHHSKMFQALAYMFKHAQKSAWFYFPYFTPDEEFSALLIDAAKKLEIKIITNCRSTWDVSQKGFVAQVSHYPDLIKAGIKVYEWQGHAPLTALTQKGFTVKEWPGNTMHSKIALFDESVVFIGSNNMNHQSLNWNNETMAMINNEPFAKKIADIFNGDLTGQAQVEAPQDSAEIPSLPLVKAVTLDDAQQFLKKHSVTEPVWSYPLGL